MKKRNMIAALLCSACLVAGSVNPVFADASKVVTLGADLTDAQKQTMMKYFNVSSDQVQVMTITMRMSINTWIISHHSHRSVPEL